MELVYEVGDVVTLKKGHPCGSKEWEILRVGADFRLKCMGCGHQIMVPRKMVEKNTNCYTFLKKNNQAWFDQKSQFNVIRRESGTVYKKLL